MFTRFTALGVAIALSASTAFAGGLSPEIVEASSTQMAPPPAGPSINPTYVLVGVLAALLVVAVASDGDDDTTEEECEGKLCLDDSSRF